MLCAFEGPPRIVRIHGRGEAVLRRRRALRRAARPLRFDEPAAGERERAIVIVSRRARIADSCGYGVPLMSYEGEREHGELWAAKKPARRGPGGRLRDYQRDKNALSLDGLPAVEG